MSEMSELSLDLSDRLAIPSVEKCRHFASRQRLSAEQCLLPRVREQLLRSAEKWEFLAESGASAMPLGQPA